MEKQQVKFPQIVNVGCGFDVHQAVIVATVRKSDAELRPVHLKPTQVL